MKSTSTTEQELREEEAPWPKTLIELNEYIGSLTDRNHDYGTCVYAMSLAATATFNYVAGRLGTTGFQSSCADLDILRRSRRMKGPFIILKAEDMLFPQYDLPEKLQEAMQKWIPWAAEECAKLLVAENGQVHPHVKAHWEKMAAWPIDTQSVVEGRES